jgi:hypothetical protein
MRNAVPLFEIWQAEIGSYLAEFVILLQQFGDLCLVGVLVDLVSAVELLNVVDQPEQAVNLFFVLETGLLMTA